VDLVLFLKAVPYEISEDNVEHISLFNFKSFQESLLAHQNLFIVNAFEYYDDKSRERAFILKDNLNKQKPKIHELNREIREMHKKMRRNE